MSLTNRLPQTLAWGIVAVVLGAVAQASSMAELASIQPIAGAQYHWTHHLAPERQKRFITWMQGWVTWFAWVSALAGSTSSEGNILLGLVKTNHPWYNYQPWHLTVVIIGQLVAAGLLNTYAFRAVPWLEVVGAVLHVVLFFVFVIVLVALSPRHDARFVFFGTSTESGWHDAMVSWNLGLLVPAWGFVGFDGVVHMSEEVKQARSAVPRAMIWTVVFNGILAYVMVLGGSDRSRGRGGFVLTPTFQFYFSAWETPKKCLPHHIRSSPSAITLPAVLEEPP